MWKYTVDIAQVLKKYPDEATFEQTRDSVAETIRESGLFQGMARQLETAQDIERFDDILEQIYDYADLNRIWLGI